MTTDLWMLVYTTLLCVALPLVYVSGRLAQPGGIPYGFGNRDNPPEDEPAWIGRADRAHRNLLENLAPFAVLVIVAHVTGKANDATAFGATLFFWGRVLHAIIYIAGIPYARTAAFAVSVFGFMTVLFELF